MKITICILHIFLTSWSSKKHFYEPTLCVCNDLCITTKVSTKLSRQKFCICHTDKHEVKHCFTNVYVFFHSSVKNCNIKILC